MTIAIVTTDLDWVRAETKDPLLMAALRTHSLESDRVPWDAAVDWSSYDAVVVSTTWDYHNRIAEFLAWVDRVSEATTMWNAPEIIRWNANKNYLIQMFDAGLPVIPTIATRSAGTVIEAAATWGADRVVIKPIVSASARGTARFRGDDIAGIADHLMSLPEMMIAQPFQPAVETDGETSLVYFNGQYSHAVRKIPADGDFRTQTHLGGTLVVTDATSIQQDVAEASLTFLAHAPLYARVDLIEGMAGPLLIELELIEPALFLSLCAGAAERFAAAIATRM